MLTKIIISIIPILAYSIFWLWAIQLINSKLTNKGDKKKYKKYFRKRLTAFFAPIFLLSVLISVLLYPNDDDFVGLGLVNFIVKALALLIQLIISIDLFFEIKKDIYILRTQSVEDIIKSNPDKK